MATEQTSAAAAPTSEFFAFERHGSAPIFGRGTLGEAGDYVRLLSHGASLNHYSMRRATPVEASSIRRGSVSAFDIADEHAKHWRIVAGRQ